MSGYKKRRRKIRAVIALLLLTLVVTLSFAFVDRFVNPVIYELSEANVRSLTTKAVSGAITTVIGTGTEYSELIKVVSDADGKIQMLQADSIKINALARNTARTAQMNIDVIGSQGIQIPIGSLSGIPIFAGKGPSISVKFVPVGSILGEFSSSFSSAGINQTLHRIYLQIKADVNIVLPGAAQNMITIVTEVLVTESIIIGEVPGMYLQSGSPDGLLNLIP